MFPWVFRFQSMKEKVAFKTTQYVAFASEQTDDTLGVVEIAQHDQNMFVDAYSQNRTEL